MKHIYKIVFLLFVSIYSISCNRDSLINDVEFIDANKISRLELSVNSPILDADGKAKLNFKVKGIYKYNDKEHLMLSDRMPLDEIEVIASTGEKFNVQEAFSTKHTGKIDFYCKFNEKISEKVSVKAITPTDENYTPIVIPVQIYVLYDDTSYNKSININEENFKKLFDKVNDVFAGKLIDAPSSCDSKISFKLVKFKRIKEKVDTYDVAEYINKNMMDDVENYFTIWVAEYFPWSLFADNCYPRYTFGNPDDIPGLDLRTVSNTTEIDNHIQSNFGADNASVRAKGLTMSYYDFYDILNSNLGTEVKFSGMIGKAYGLLDTGDYNPEGNSIYQNSGDLDYCDDTFSYLKKYKILEKSVAILEADKEKGLPVNYYDSFNIMDTYSTASTISRDQIKRIRQVIKDCPYRQMKL